MKVTAIYLYPIKGLRAISLPSTRLTPQGLLHDRNFMLCRVLPDGSYEKLQLDRHPRCARFGQELVDAGRDGFVRVHWLGETDQDEKGDSIDVPLAPGIENLEKTVMNLHQSKVHAYLMPETFNAFFTTHFAFPTVLLYIGDGKRPVLGTFSPKSAPSTSAQGPSSWLSSITSVLPSLAGMTGGEQREQEASRAADWLTFTDCAPFLLATEASLQDVNARFDGEEKVDIPMYKFRPNIVLDGVAAWDEDFWSQLSLRVPSTDDKDGVEDSTGETSTPLFTLTKLCNRCTSLNVDYDAGAMSTDAPGTLLKRLMKDRRVDMGNKYSPVFGRYGFLSEEMARVQVQQEQAGLKVGDHVEVTGRVEERPTWDWPMRDPKTARFYTP